MPNRRTQSTSSPSHRLKADPGFSRIEILVVVIFAGIACSALAGLGVNRVELARINSTHTLLDDVADGVAEYRLDRGKYPVSLASLLQGDSPYLKLDDEPMDSWGRRLKYDIQNDQVVIRSSGPDHAFDTADDLSNLQPAPSS